MQNCYKSGKLPNELSEQDERLTQKHIQTLKFVQEIHVENKELRARVEELEKELSKCSELHALAENSQSRIKEIQQQYMARADEINQMLVEKHKNEVMKRVGDHVENEKQWTEEKRKLLTQIEQLKKDNQRLKDELDIARDQKGSSEDLQSKLLNQAEEMKQLHSENTRLQVALRNQMEEIQRLQYMDDKCRNMAEQISELTQQNKELQFRIDKLQREMGDSGFNQQEDLLNSLKSKLGKLHTEKQDWARREKDQEALIREMKEELEKLRKAYGDSERMRADLKVQYDALLLEMNLLKKQSGGDRQNFREFVQLKRDMAVVLEENKELKLKLKYGKEKRHSVKQAEDVTVLKLDSGGRNSRREPNPSYSKR